jgi:hypothetical protein
LSALQTCYRSPNKNDLPENQKKSTALNRSIPGLMVFHASLDAIGLKAVICAVFPWNISDVFTGALSIGKPRMRSMNHRSDRGISDGNCARAAHYFEFRFCHSGYLPNNFLYKIILARARTAYARPTHKIQKIFSLRLDL